MIRVTETRFHHFADKSSFCQAIALTYLNFFIRLKYRNRIRSGMHYHVEQGASVEAVDDEATGPTQETPTVTSVGGQIKRFRQLKGLSLESLAARSSVSAGALSQLERGQGNPSFNTLVQIAHAFEVPVTRLFSYPTTDSPVVRVKDRRPLDLHSGVPHDGIRSTLLTPIHSLELEAIFVETEPGYSSENEPFIHQGQEFGFIIEGPHEVVVDGQIYVLESGDTITYPSTLPHWYRNTGRKATKAIWVVTPPSF